MRARAKSKLVGRRYGRLVVLDRAPDYGAAKQKWLVVCDCGSKKTVQASSLYSGATRSCGCLQRELTSKRSFGHGKIGTPAHRSWASMITRCTDRSRETFQRYGGRGISVCKRWRAFENFLADMGERPEGTSLDRVDVNGNYEPGNCRWATPSQQANNKRSNRVVVLGGRSQTIAQWAIETGIGAGNIWNRLNMGWPADLALTRPVKAVRR